MKKSKQIFIKENDFDNHYFQIWYQFLADNDGYGINGHYILKVKDLTI